MSVCAVFSMSVSAVVSILAAILGDSPPASNDSDIFSLISWVIKLAVRPATAASWPVLTIRDIRHGTRAVSVGLAFHQFLVLLFAVVAHRAVAFLTKLSLLRLFSLSCRPIGGKWGDSGQGGSHYRGSSQPQWV